MRAGLRLGAYDRDNKTPRLGLELDADAVGNRLSVEPETATHIDLLIMLRANQKTPDRSEIMELFALAVIQS